MKTSVVAKALIVRSVEDSGCVDLNNRLEQLYNSPGCALAKAIVSEDDFFGFGRDERFNNEAVGDAICAAPSCIDELSAVSEGFADQGCMFTGSQNVGYFFGNVRTSPTDFQAVADLYCSEATGSRGGCFEQLMEVPNHCGMSGVDKPECFSAVDCGTCLQEFLNVAENQSADFEEDFGIPPNILALAREASEQDICAVSSSGVRRDYAFGLITGAMLAYAL